MTGLRLLGATLACAASANASAFNESFSVSPATPLAGQEFSLTFTGMVGCIPLTISSAQVSANRIEIRAQEGNEACFSPPTQYTITHPMVIAAAGQYDVAYQLSGSPMATLGKLTVAPASSASATLNGIWYDPAAPGSGMSITEGAQGNLFVVWFTFRKPAGVTYFSQHTEPSWFMVSDATKVTATEYAGRFYETIGTGREKPYFPYNLQVKDIGTAKLVLVAPDTLQFTTTNTVTPPVAVTLKRFDF